MQPDSSLCPRFTPSPTVTQRKARLPSPQIRPLGNTEAHNVEKVKRLGQTTLQWRRIFHCDSARKRRIFNTNVKYEHSCRNHTNWKLDLPNRYNEPSVTLTRLNSSPFLKIPVVNLLWQVCPANFLLNALRYRKRDLRTLQYCQSSWVRSPLPGTRAPHLTRYQLILPKASSHVDGPLTKRLGKTSGWPALHYTHFHLS